MAEGGRAERVALIVAHGQPSDPGPAEAEIAALAARVAARLPGWSVRSATLAAEGALAAAVAGEGPIVVYPLFMADGWFTQTHLPARLAAAGAADARLLAPFGLDPAVQALTVRRWPARRRGRTRICCWPRTDRSAAMRLRRWRVRLLRGSRRRAGLRGS